MKKKKTIDDSTPLHPCIQMTLIELTSACVILGGIRGDNVTDVADKILDKVTEASREGHRMAMATAGHGYNLVPVAMALLQALKLCKAEILKNELSHSVATKMGLL